MGICDVLALFRWVGFSGGSPEGLGGFWMGLGVSWVISEVLLRSDLNRYLGVLIKFGKMLKSILLITAVNKGFQAFSLAPSASSRSPRHFGISWAPEAKNMPLL